MKKILLIIIYIFPWSSLISDDHPKKRLFDREEIAAKILGREDRKYGDHSGNRVLCRFYIKAL